MEGDSRRKTVPLFKRTFLKKKYYQPTLETHDISPSILLKLTLGLVLCIYMLIQSNKRW